jgi:sodium/proline symporter
VVVLIIALLALILASDPNAGSIMDLVSNAWGVFGAAFGPAILLSLFWKRFTFKGAVAGISVGALVDIVWLIIHNSQAAAIEGYNGIFCIYEIVPGFIAGAIAAVVVTLLDKKPSADVEALFDRAVSLVDDPAPASSQKNA